MKVSRELQDEIGENLTGINLKLETLKRDAAVSSKALKSEIDSTQRLVEKSRKITQRLAGKLRPTLLDDLGLIPALRAMITDFSKKTGLRVRFLSYAGVEELDHRIRTVLYRVVEESLLKILLHAKASSVKVTLEKISGACRLTVEDGGKSSDAARLLGVNTKKRLEVLGMRERVEMVGGIFTVEFLPGKGSVIRAEIPVS